MWLINKIKDNLIQQDFKCIYIKLNLVVQNKLNKLTLLNIFQIYFFVFSLYFNKYYYYLIFIIKK